MPCAIVAAGWFGFSMISVEIEKEPPPEAKKLTLRTRVEDLEVIDYPVVVKTHAIVQAHNQVSLAAEVSGRVASVSNAFEVGAYFAKGEVLVEIDPRDYETALAIAKSQLVAAQSALKLAKLNEERRLRLVASQAVSQSDADSASAAREQAEADVELAATQVEQAELNLERTKVLAPFDGRVQSKMIGVGQMANPNSPLGEVFAVDFAEVRLPISGEQRRFLTLPEFADDPSVDVTLRDAINEASDHTWRAKIVRTEGVLDENSRDLFAIARIDDPFGRGTGEPPLRIGQPVVASIEGKVLKGVIALPRRAVRQLDKIVLVKPADQTLLPLNVRSLWSDAENVIVGAAEVPVGMWLATTPLAFTPEGAKVEIIPEADASVSIADSTPPDADQNAAN